MIQVQNARLVKSVIISLLCTFYFSTVSCSETVEKYETLLWSDTPASLEPFQILKNMDEAIFPQSFTMDFTLVSHSAKGKERTYKLSAKAIKKIGTTLAFHSPATESGKKYLFKDRNIWIAIPGVPNPIRVSARENFMDSEFSNNDILDVEFGDDYTPALESTSIIDGREVIYLKCSAKSPRVAYSKIIMAIDAKTFIPIKFRYYSNSGLLLKTCVFGEVKQLAGRDRASRFEMRDASLKESYSIITIASMNNAQLSKNLFSVEGIRR